VSLAELVYGWKKLDRMPPSARQFSGLEHFVTASQGDAALRTGSFKRESVNVFEFGCEHHGPVNDTTSHMLWYYTTRLRPNVLPVAL